jgi:hypothetical protein
MESDMKARERILLQALIWKVIQKQEDHYSTEGPGMIFNAPMQHSYRQITVPPAYMSLASRLHWAVTH